MLEVRLFAHSVNYITNLDEPNGDGSLFRPICYANTPAEVTVALRVTVEMSCLEDIVDTRA